jgi:hypothetical protein
MAVQDFSGSGDPNGVVTGSPGDTYQNDAGGSGNTFWVKESGVATDTGWVPMTSASVGPGTVNTVAKFTGSNAVGDSSITDDGTLITANESVAIIGNTPGVNALEVTPTDTGPATVRLHGIPNQAESTLRISIDETGQPSGFIIDCAGVSGGHGGIQVVHRTTTDPGEWGIWDMQLVAQLGRQLFIPDFGNANLQQGVLGLQTVQFVHTRFAAGPGTLTIPGIAVPSNTPGFAANPAFAHGDMAIFISNYGGTADLILSNEDPSVNPEWRFKLPGGVNFHIAPQRGVWLTALTFQPLFAELRWFIMSP